MMLLCVSPRAEGRPFSTGVSYGGPGTPLEFKRVTNLGATLTHQWFHWDRIAPKTQPTQWNPRDPADVHYNWSAFDSWVTNAVGAGLTPSVLLYGAPTWAQRCQSGGSRFFNRAPCNPDPEMMADFAYAAATRYSGAFQDLPRVRYWQVQNEPNLSLFFGPQFDPEGRPKSPRIYRALLKPVYESIKSVDSSNVVLAAGLAPIGGDDAIAPLEFTRKLLCMAGRNRPRPTKRGCEAGVYFDVFDIHPYTTGGPMHQSQVEDAVQLRDLEKLTALLRAADRANRIRGMYPNTPLWVTEFSWDSQPGDPGGLPMRTMKQWAPEAMYRAWRAGVKRFFWFSLRDQDTGDQPHSETVQAGLFTRGATIEQDELKPFARAFTFPFVGFANRNPQRFSYWGRTPTSKRGRVRIQFRGPGVRAWKTVDRVRANVNGVFKGSVRSKYAARRRGHLRARVRNDTSLAFSLRRIEDFYQPPFGRPVE